MNLYQKIKSSVYFQVVITLLFYCFFSARFFKYFYNIFQFTNEFKALSRIICKFASVSLEKLNIIPFHSFSIILETLSHPLPLTFAIVFVLPAVIFWKKIGWKNHENYSSIRWFILFIAGIVIWEYAAYPYNYYLDQNHYIDRGLLVVFGALIYISPSFIPFFLINAVLMLSQFNYPMLGYSLSDNRILFDILFLFVAYLYVSIFIKIKSNVFLMLALCLHLSNYLASGIEKMTISPHCYEWVKENELYAIVYFSRAMGWWSFVPDAFYKCNIGFIKTFNFPLQIFIIISELSVVFCFYRKKWCVIILCSLCLLHAIIFLETGIFFWTWILVNIGFIFLAGVLDKGVSQFNFSNLILSGLVLIVILISPYFNPIKLAWWDTRLINFYRIEAVDESGGVYLLNKNELAPYDIFFTFHRLFFLNQEPILINGQGSMDYQEAIYYRTIDPTELAKAEKKRGFVYYNSEKSRIFEEFIQKSVNTINRLKGKRALLNCIKPPHHCYTSLEGIDIHAIGKPIKQVNVRFIEVFFSENGFEVLQDKVIREIAIPKP